MSQESRYLEEVALGSDAYEQLAGTWVGEEEEHDGQSLQQERLELKADGTFKHTLAHRFTPLGDALEPSENYKCESSCSGKWRLHNIRHLGADLAATATDRELRFQSDVGSHPLLTEKLVVCGANIAVNGFIGASCRLYPSNRFSTDGNRARHRESTPELEVEEPQPTEDDAKQLAEATGRSLDACFAALLQAGSREEAAVLLLESADDSPAGGLVAAPVAPEAFLQHARPDNSSSSHSGATTDATPASAEAVAEATGRPLAQCEEALRAHDGKVNDAVDYLLSLPDVEHEPIAPSAADQVKAARLTEISGLSFEKCLEVLRKMNGNAERAAASLLGLEEVAAEPSHDVADRTEEMAADDLDETAIDAETASWEANNAVLRASADVEAAINAEVDAALGGAGDESPSSPSSKRRRLG
jgi:hypothetical protein